MRAGARQPPARAQDDGVISRALARGRRESGCASIARPQTSTVTETSSTPPFSDYGSARVRVARVPAA